MQKKKREKITALEKSEQALETTLAAKTLIAAARKAAELGKRKEAAVLTKYAGRLQLEKSRRRRQRLLTRRQ